MPDDQIPRLAARIEEIDQQMRALDEERRTTQQALCAAQGLRCFCNCSRPIIEMPEQKLDWGGVDHD
jgi:hypothetical protein